MDSLTGSDDEQDFFEGYAAEQANLGLSLAASEFNDLEPQPPTPAELAHRARFRKPVAVVISSMALLSLVALGMQGSLTRDPSRELVAHYSAALAAPSPVEAPTATATVRPAAAAPEASSALPEALAALLAEVWSSLDPAPAKRALTKSSTQPDASLFHAYVPPLSPICLLPPGSEVSRSAAVAAALESRAEASSAACHGPRQ